MRSRAFVWIFAFFAGTFLRGSIPSHEKGRIHGILTSKAEAWVEVKDDKGYAHRYLAPWYGNSPSSGGFFKQEILDQIKEVVVGNRVTLDWMMDRHLRVLDIKVTKPKWKKTLFEGYLLEIGDRWIDVQNKNEGIPWRFYLPWVGGYPSSGGGYDQSILALLREHKPTNPIIFEWSYELRPRIVKLFSREELSFKPFYELDKVPSWLGSPRVSKIAGEGFAQKTDKLKARPVNPFDAVAGEVGFNPFDNLGGKTDTESVGAPMGGSVNPFDQAANTQPSSSINPFASVSNPFENISPFEQASVDKLSTNSKLDELVLSSVELKEVSLPDALMVILRKARNVDQKEKRAEFKGVKLRIDLDGMEASDEFPKVSVSLKQEKIGKVISEIVASVGWTFSIQEEVIVVRKQQEKIKPQIPANPFDSLNQQTTNPFDLGGQ